LFYQFLIPPSPYQLPQTLSSHQLLPFQPKINQSEALTKPSGARARLLNKDFCKAQQQPKREQAMRFLQATKQIKQKHK
jgi:hypothetical protein